MYSSAHNHQRRWRGTVVSLVFVEEYPCIYLVLDISLVLVSVVSIQRGCYRQRLIWKGPNRSWLLWVKTLVMRWSLSCTAYSSRWDGSWGIILALIIISNTSWKLWSTYYGGFLYSGNNWKVQYQSSRSIWFCWKSKMGCLEQSWQS